MYCNHNVLLQVHQVEVELSVRQEQNELLTGQSLRVDDPTALHPKVQLLLTRRQHLQDSIRHLEQQTAFRSPTEAHSQVCVVLVRTIVFLLILLVERQKGLTTSHLHSQLDPFASKLMICYLPP